LTRGTVELLKEGSTSREASEVSANPVGSVPHWVVSELTRERTENVVNSSVQKPLRELVGSVSNLEIGVSRNQLKDCCRLGCGKGHEGKANNQ